MGGTSGRVLKIIVLFVIFASFLQIGGATEAFMEIPKALFGRFRGGPAKIAVVASALFGTFSGSATANVVGTGVFTIPMMKKTGYKPAMAGAVEALASTGGQFMPPVMGAGAFVMAELLQISYWDVCIAATLPALLYYLSLFMIVDIEAARTGLKGIPREQLPNVWKAFIQYWPTLIPLVCLIYFMAVAGVSITRASLYAIIAMVVVSWFRKDTRMGFKKIYLALENGMRMMIMITIVCACAGIIIGSLYLTGIGLSISTVLVKLSHGILIILLLMTALVTILLGMGMPTTAVYLFSVFIIAPAMAELGTPMLAAHLFLFIYGALGAITPPVCIASYAAAAIAQEDPMKVGWTAFRFGIIGFIVPFFFVLNPVLIMRGALGEIILGTITAVIGVCALAIMLQGYFLQLTKKLERVCFGLGGLLLLKPGLTTDLIGGILVAAGMISQIISRRKEKKLASEFCG